MTLTSTLRVAVRRAFNAFGYQIAKVPPATAPPPDVLPAQAVDGVGTHVPPLAAAVARTTGPVLELGMGDHSTPLLHILCGDRRLVSADHSPAWTRRFERFRSSTHEIHAAPDWAAFKALEQERWAVAFVDATPSEQRVQLLERLRGRATYIVVHDTDPDIESAAVFALQGALARFRYRADYRVFRPFTTVVSDERPFELTPGEQ